MTRRWRSEAERHAFFLSKKVDKAVREHNMIEDGDRILVGVSGGKDSMSLLRLLAYRLDASPAKYELVAAHVVGDARGADMGSVPEAADASGGFLPRSFGGSQSACAASAPFLDWLEAEGVPHVVTNLIVPEDEPLPMGCERCGRNRRRTLFEVAEKHGCNKVALGHHLEDFAHTALLNLFYSGRLETMAFRRDYFGGEFAVIRPLAYVREHELVRFAKTCGFPLFDTGCPMAPTSRRKAASDLMRTIGRQFRSASVNIVKAAGVIGEED